MQRWTRVPESFHVCGPKFMDFAFEFPHSYVPVWHIICILALPRSCFAFLRRRGGGEAHSGGASTGRGLFSSERRHLGGAPSEREGKRGGGMMNGSSLLQVRLCETEQISRDVCPVFLLFFFVSKFSFSHVSRAVYMYVQYVAKYCVPFALIITL